MNPNPVSPLIRPPARRRPWFWIGLALLLISFVALGGIALGAVSYLHLSSDMRALRNGWMKASGVAWRQNLGLNLGSMTLGVVRAGLSLAPLDAEPRAAVQTLRGIEVGIYERAPGTNPPDRAALLAVAQNRLGQVFQGMGDAEQAQSSFRSAVETMARAVEMSPGHAGWKNELDNMKSWLR